MFEVGNEGGGGLIQNRTVFGVLFFEKFVSVPVADAFAAGLVGAVEELDEADAFLDEASGEDAVAGVGGFKVADGIAGVVGAVKFADVFGFGAEVADFGDAELHSGRQFVAGYAGGEFAVAGEAFEVVLIQALEEITGAPITLWRDASRPIEIPDGGCGIEICALKGGREKSGPPAVDAGLGGAAGIGDGHVGGE